MTDDNKNNNRKENSSFKKEYDSSMDSKYYFSEEARRIGATGSPQTPNQIGEVTSRLNQGLKAVEIGTMNQRLLDQIPKEHFTEIRRLGELTGAEASIHAPIQDLDLAGFTQQGQNEFERQENIEKLKSTIDRAHLMDPTGNVPITVHGGSFPAQKWKKGKLFGPEETTVDGHKIKDYTITEESKPLKDARSEMVIVNQDTGQMQAVRYEEKEYVSGEKQVWTPERRMDNLNATSWDQEQLQLMQLKKDLTEVEDRFQKSIPKLIELRSADKKKLLTDNEKKELARLEQEEQTVQQYGNEIYQNIRSMAEEMHNRYIKYKQEPKTERDREMKKKFEDNMKIISQEENKIEKLGGEIEKIDQKREPLKEDTQKYKDLTQDLYEKYDELNKRRQQETDLIVRNFANTKAPNTWVSADDFSKEKVSDSITDAAHHAYKEYGEKAPIICVENVYPEFTLSRADSLKETIDTTRKKFAETLVEKEKLSKKKAEEVAEKLIGVTWDVGHIYMLRKHGYTDEDIKKEVEKIAKQVKHIHLTDNFGFEDSHLPPGEGIGNIKDQLSAIRKSLGKEEYEKTRAIVEAGEFVANFKEVPHLYALSDLNSPLYKEKIGPYWKDIWDTAGHYFGGFGEMMPQKYFDLYGAPGFSQLPTSLGGTAGTPEKGRLATSPETEAEAS